MSARTRKLLASICLMVVIAVAQKNGWLPAQTQQSKTAPAAVLAVGQYRVTEFADGDTITVDMNGTKERIRMIGVDTPETHDPRKPVQCFGQAASKFTRDLIGSGPVRLEADSLNTNRDRYQRLLRYVYNDSNQLVNHEIIKQGYGFAYLSFPFERLEEFKQSEKEAREQKRGLWSQCTPELDSKGFIRSNPEQ